MSTEAEAEGAVTYLDALEIFTRGDVEQVKKIIPQWMAAYNSSDEGGEGDALISSCTPLHLAVQCPRKEVVAAILEFDQPPVPVNATDGHGATALQLAAKAARRDVVKMLLRHGADDLAQDKQGHDALAYAAEPGVAAVLQDHRTEQAHAATAQLFAAARGSDSAKVEQTLEAVASRADVAGRNSDGGTLLHAAVQGGHETLARWAIAEGVDVFARDAHDKSAEAYAADNTRMRELLNQAPMGNARTVQPERAPRLSGSLHKWTNYAGGWKARWFELEDGVLSYYKNQADADSACRGAINLRVAKIGMVGRDRTQFEILGKGSVKYRVKAPDAAIAKQWVHLLNVSKQWALMRLKDTEDPSSPSAPSTEDAVAEDHGAPQRPRTSSLLRSKAADTPTSVRTSTPQSQHMRTQHQRRTSASSARSGNGEARSPRSSQLDGSPSVHSAADSTVESSSESDDEMYSTRNAFFSTLAELRAQLFIQDRLLEGLRKTEPLSQSSEELARYRNIATQTTAQSRDLVATLDRVYRESSAAWQARMRREQERIDMLADSLRSAVVSSQTLLESVRQKQDTVDQELKHQQNQEEARVPDALAAASSCMSNYGLSAAAPPEDDEEEDFADASDEFFDAVTSVVSLGPSAVQSTTPSPAAEREEALQKDMTLQKGEELPQKGLTTGGEEISQTVSPQDDISLHKKQSRQPTDLTALSGYPAAQTVRTTLPPITHGGPSLNLWSIIKGAIGKDLSKVSVPVFFNEPTSFLQRFTEDMEYSELLELAARLPRSADRTLFVAGFAMSNYASTFGRIAKPFNPLLGETFEYVRRDRKYRALSEQVEHHPPISACWVEGANFVYHADTNIKSKFNSGSLTVVPTGVCHVELRLPLAFLDCPEERNAGDARQSPNINHEEGYFTEHYTWNKLTTNVNGIMLANFWIEHVGDLNVVNHRTGDATKITFMQSGWTGKNKFKVTGESLDRRGQRVYEIAGDWTSRLVARPVGSEASADQAAEPVVYSNDTDHANSASTGDAVGFAAAHIVEVPRKPFVLWKINERPTQDNNYHLTTFAMSLNDKPSGLEPFLCPSDSRFRPDQRAMEVGEYELADREKSRLENKQRATRRRREQGELESWNPRWFEKALDEDSGEEFWRFNGQYWSERERVAEIKKQDENTKNQPSSIELWSGVEDIF
ncbi:hypothetical protein COEREDRAFT_102622 [Coemansia reversa NRRL 1564]|uniref:PH domain-containing protein n=1 Tax=Coemansia reversa (strain ATCC 12441 / NRRL 1564) TaxID=763665 RepID=A0A2G5BAF4_COERN|nr:hypothetical protein COEREDRAFT_102622 [Coemansia reversa NRRL 1564]|eukprot:PIA15993.1 hypothetical protein COEREDRAFT_102622 [Coemansia reversa NRRL 1564]